MAGKNHNAIDNRMTEWETRANRKHVPNSKMGSFRGVLYQNLGHHQDDPNYGCPVAGSKTEYRGKQAGVNVSSEVVELCDIIQQLGTAQQDGTVVVPFGELFEFYTRISNKLVGMLLRARRHGLVEFEGEMLFQRRDDHVLIYLVRLPDDLTAEIERGKTELRQHSSKK